MIGSRVGMTTKPVVGPRVSRVGRWPTSPAEMAAALGYGDWTNGAAWLCNELSGNLAPAFGSPTLTANSLTYGLPGPLREDNAIQYDAQTDFADGGNNFDPGANDLIVVDVVKWATAPTSPTRCSVSKVAAVAASGWSVISNATANAFFVVDGGGVKLADLGTAGTFVGEYATRISVMDRSTGKIRFATRGLVTGTTSITAETTVSGNVTSAATFRLGQSAYNDAPINLYVAFSAVVVGANVATGLSANLATAIQNFAAWVMP